MFRERLQQEFAVRKQRNARYSLRAFAASLDADHSTVAQILRGDRRAPAGSIHKWSRKLGLSQEEAAVYVAAEHVPDAATSHRLEQLRHWSAEAIGVLSDRTHWDIIRLSHSSGFQPDSRWIALQSNCTVDQVNLALSRLLRLGLLETDAAGRWHDRTGLPSLTERQFRKLALARIRQLLKE